MRANLRFVQARAFLTAGAILLASVGTLSGQRAESSAELAAKIDRLIQQLGDDSFQVREKAEQELTKIGEPATEKLTAASKDASFERSERAAKVLLAVRRSGVGLRHVGITYHQGLAGAVTVALSADGRYLYAQGFQAHAVNTFRRDELTGALTHVQTYADPAQIGGAVKLRLSSDGRQAVVACYAAKSIGLFTRDAKTGELELVATWRDQPELPLEWPIDAIFSTDGKFVYAVDDRKAAVVALRPAAERKRLELFQSFEGDDRCFDGARGITAHPDGKTLYVSSYRAGTLTVVERQAGDDRLRVRQVLRDEQEGVHGLAGAVAARASSDGKFVYTTGGRFGGDDSIGVFRVGPDGKLSIVQEFINDQGDLKDYTGGNQLAFSHDEKLLYASGTTSSGLACFRRDATTGKLDYLMTIRNESTGLGANLGANGIVCSPDGRFLYLALEDAGAISVFERTAAQP